MAANTLETDLASQTQEAYLAGLAKEWYRLDQEARLLRATADRAALRYLDTVENGATRLEILSDYRDFLENLVNWYQQESYVLELERQIEMAAAAPERAEAVAEESAAERAALDDHYTVEAGRLAEIGNLSPAEIENIEKYGGY